MPRGTPTVAEAEAGYYELLFAIRDAKENVCHPNMTKTRATTDGGQLVIFSAECTCGDSSHYWGTAQWCAYPPEDCWTKD